MNQIKGFRDDAAVDYAKKIVDAARTDKKKAAQVMGSLFKLEKR